MEVRCGALWRDVVSNVFDFRCVAVLRCDALRAFFDLNVSNVILRIALRVALRCVAGDASAAVSALRVCVAGMSCRGYF